MQNLAETSRCLDARIAAFAAAEYLVNAGTTAIAIDLGRPTPELNRLLEGRHWAIVTAHNPDGRLQSTARNRAAHVRLGQCLERMEPAICLSACNRDPAGEWPDEPGWLFTPDSLACADRLARRLGQRAIVAGVSGKAAELRVYGAGGGSLPQFARVVES